jgi:hypothetical protein
VRRRLVALEQTGFLRLLRPLGEGAGKRAAPVLYLRNLRLLEGLPPEQRYRTRLVEAIAAVAAGAEPAGPKAAEPKATGRIGYLGRPHGGILEPVVEIAGADGPALVGFAICAAALPRRRMWTTLTRAQRLGLLRQGFVLYPGSRAFFSAGKVAVVPDGVFLGGYAEWMAAALDPSAKGLQRLMRRCNAPAGDRLTLSRPGG